MERLIRFLGSPLLIAARFESSKSFNEQLQKRIGLLCTWVALAATAIPIERIARNSGAFAAWWLVIGIMCATIIVLVALAGAFLPIGVLRAFWVAFITLVFASQLLAFLAYDPTKQLTRLWVWEFIPLSCVLVALLFSFGAAICYLVASALTVPISALLFYGELPFEVIVEFPAAVATSFFVIGVSIVQSRLQNLKKAIDLRALTEIDLAQTRSRETVRINSNRLIHDEVLGLLNAALMLKGQSSAPLSQASHDVQFLLQPKEHMSEDDGLISLTPTDAALSSLRKLISHPTSPSHVQLKILRTDEAVPSDAWNSVLQATGEALRNVRRHSGATRTKILLTLTAETISVTIRDNGIGFDPLQAELASRGIVRSIIERMGEVGGHATIFSEPGSGSEISLTWTTRNDTVDPHQQETEDLTTTQTSGLDKRALRGALLVTLVSVLVVEFWQRAPFEAESFPLNIVMASGVALVLPIFILTNASVARLTPVQSTTSVFFILLNSVLSQPINEQWIPWQFIMSIALSALLLLRGNSVAGIGSFLASIAVGVSHGITLTEENSRYPFSTVVLAVVLFLAAVAWRIGLVVLMKHGTKHFNAITKAQIQTAAIQTSMEALATSLNRARTTATPVLKRISFGEIIHDDLYKEIWFTEAALRDDMNAPNLQYRGLPEAVRKLRIAGIPVNFVTQSVSSIESVPAPVLDRMVHLVNARSDVPITRCVIGNKPSDVEEKRWFVTIIRGSHWELNEIGNDGSFTVLTQNQHKRQTSPQLAYVQPGRGNSE